MSQPRLDVLIVDDEPPARERLERLVAELPDWAVAGSCGSGGEALNLVNKLNPAVVLLDIRMPGMGGVEAARHLASLPAPPAVVFTTAYDEYAMEAFDAQAVGYLLKPVRKERLAQALRQAGRLSASQLQEVASANDDTAPRQAIAVRVREELLLIPVKDIRFFRADQKYVTVHHVEGEHLIDESLKVLADEFAPDFVRIHRSILVAVAHIEAVEKDPSGKPFVRIRGSAETLSVSRRQVGALKRHLTGT